MRRWYFDDQQFKGFLVTGNGAFNQQGVAVNLFGSRRWQVGTHGFARETLTGDWVINPVTLEGDGGASGKRRAAAKAFYVANTPLCVNPASAQAARLCSNHNHMLACA